MYLYTPKKSLLSDFLRAKKKGSTYTLVGQWLRSQNYTVITVFSEHWAGTKLYSPTQLKKVPVNGALYSIEFFDETKVEQS
jgi:hypothetical protein